MAKLVIKNLAESKELDRNAMKAISGGMTPFSPYAVGSFHNGGWPDVCRANFGTTVSSIPYPTDGVTNTTTITARKEKIIGSSTTVSDDGGIGGIVLARTK